MRRFHGSLLCVLVVALAAMGRPFSGPILRAASADALQYLLTLGNPQHYGVAPGAFVAPQGAAYDASGRLYVSDTQWSDVVSDRIQVFDADHQYLYDLTATGTPLAYPIGMAVDANGRLLVADALNDRIVLFDAAAPGSRVPPPQLMTVGVHGNFDPLDIWSADRQAGKPPLSPVVFFFPTGVAVKPGTRLLDPTDTLGRAAVVDNSNHRVIVFDAMLRPLYDFGGHAEEDVDSPAGMMEYPWDVAIDAAGQFYVTDADNSRIQVFREEIRSGRPAAGFVRLFGSRRDAAGNFGSEPGDVARPYAIEFDSAGRAWITDPDWHRAMRIDVTHSVGSDTGLMACEHVVTRTGESRCTIATSDGLTYEALVVGGHGAGGKAAFSYPIGIAVNGDGEVAIADTDNHDVQILRTSRVALDFADEGLRPGDTLAVGQPAAFTVTLNNSGSLPLDVTLAPSVSSNGQPFDGEFGGTLRGALAAGETATFAMTFTPLQSGPFSIDVDATGDARALAGGQVKAATLHLPGGIVAPRIGLSVAASSNVSVATAGDVVTLQVRLRNTGSTTLDGVLPVIAVDGAASAVMAMDTPSAVAIEPLQAAPAISYRYRLLTCGDVVFRVSATAQYLDPATQSLQSLSTSARPITIAVSADATAPHTIATVPPPSPSGWYKTPVTVRLDAVDNPGGSGVASIAYVVAEWNEPAVVSGSSANATVWMEGVSHLRFSARDMAGNVEPEQSVMVRIDTIPPDMGVPVITSAVPPANGWYRSNPTVTFVAGDGGGGSGLAWISPAVTVTTEGTNQVRTGHATDNAGNVSTEARAIVNVDKTAPIVACAPTRQAGASGWFTADVMIQCSAVDVANPAGFSGLRSVRAICSAGSEGVGADAASCTYRADGTYTFLGEATDNAGNVATTSFTIKMDKTAPMLTCGTVATGQLWPPNHKMEPWSVNVVAADAASGSGGFRLVSYSSSEAANALADGNTSVDMAGWTLNRLVSTPTAGVTSGLVRSERSGIGTGRLYQLKYETLDQAGNASTCTVTLSSVPHDRQR